MTNELRLTDCLNKAIQDSLNIDRRVSHRFSGWLTQIAFGEEVSPDFRNWLKNQIDYYNPKDPDYAGYLQSLLDKGVTDE